MGRFNGYRSWAVSLSSVRSAEAVAFPANTHLRVLLQSDATIEVQLFGIDRLAPILGRAGIAIT
jgi:hypothetical protein